MKGFKELWVSDETFQKEFLENPSSYYQQAPILWIVSIFGENPESWPSGSQTNSEIWFNVWAGSESHPRRPPEKASGYAAWHLDSRELKAGIDFPANRGECESESLGYILCTHQINIKWSVSIIHTENRFNEKEACIHKARW